MSELALGRPSPFLLSLPRIACARTRMSFPCWACSRAAAGGYLEWSFKCCCSPAVRDQTLLLVDFLVRVGLLLLPLLAVLCSTLPVVLHLPMRANLPRCATLCRLLLMPMLGGRRAGAGWSRLSGDSHKDRMGIIGQFLSQLKNTNVSFVDDSFLTPYPIIETTSVSTLGLP